MEELNTDKFEDITIAPVILLPFTQIDLSDQYYKKIFEDPSEKKLEVEMEVELFKDNDISNDVKQMDFHFTSFNGFPMDFDNMEIQFLDENRGIINSIPLGYISKATLKTDGSLDSATKKEHNIITFSINDIQNLMNTRFINAVLSWPNNPVKTPDDTYYFKINSYVVLTTNIEL